MKLAASPMMAAPAPPRSPNPFASPFGERNGPFFAKRKRNIFKGPGLSTITSGSSGRSDRGTPSHSRSVSGDRLGGGRRSGEIAAVQEEDEEEEGEEGLPLGVDEMDSDRDTVRFTGVEEEDEEIEEVDNFTPVVQGPGEKIEEVIIEPPSEIVPDKEEKARSGKSEKELEMEMNGRVGSKTAAWLGGLLEEEEEEEGDNSESKSKEGLSLLGDGALTLDVPGIGAR